MLRRPLEPEEFNQVAIVQQICDSGGCPQQYRAYVYDLYLAGTRMTDINEAQRAVAARFGTVALPLDSDVKAGIAQNVLERLQPLNALRHAPEGDTSGWYIWAGEELSDAPDFFVPLHISHLADWCPQILPYLGLSPGWRVLLAPGYEDVWFDEDLL